MDYQDKIKISELVVRNLEGDLTDQQRQELNEIVGASTDAAAWYLEFMDMLSCFTKYGTTDVPGFDFDSDQGYSQCDVEADMESNVSLRGVDSEDVLSGKEEEVAADSAFMEPMRQLAASEKTAAGVVVEKPADEAEEIEFVPRTLLFTGHGRLFFKQVACITVLCASFLLLGLWITKERPAGPPPPVVAELADSIDAVWDDELTQPDEFGYMVQSRYRLNKGYASILFEGGSMVTIEAPAELSLMSRGDMELFRGKIYATVPERAKGFTVTAGGSKIVDLGTEFGVEVGASKNIQLHVIKGRTVLFAGLLAGKKSEVNVNAGAAKKVYSDGLAMDIPVAKKKFARRIDSKNGLVFNGQFDHRTLYAGGKTFKAYFEEHDGKTWLLIGRGRDGWQFDDTDGQGSDSDVSRNLRTPAAFTPACYSDAIVNDLLLQAGLTMKDVEVRISRASSIDGKGEYQDIRWRNFNAADNGNAFTWNFEDSRYSGITVERVNAPAGLRGASVGKLIGDTNDTMGLDGRVDNADRLFTKLPEVGVNNNLRGFSYGKNVGGVNTATSFLLSYEYKGPITAYKGVNGWAMPYTEVYIEYSTNK